MDPQLSRSNLSCSFLVRLPAGPTAHPVCRSASFLHTASMDSVRQCQPCFPYRACSSVESMAIAREPSPVIPHAMQLCWWRIPLDEWCAISTMSNIVTKCEWSNRTEPWVRAVQSLTTRYAVVSYVQYRTLCSFHRGKA